MTVPRIKENRRSIRKQNEDTAREPEVEIEIDRLKVINIRETILEIERDVDKNREDPNRHRLRVRENRNDLFQEKNQQVDQVVHSQL